MAFLNTFTLGIAGGTVEGHGAIVRNDDGRKSRLRRWAQIDARQIPGAASLAGILQKSGTAAGCNHRGVAALRRLRDDRRCGVGKDDPARRARIGQAAAGR